MNVKRVGLWVVALAALMSMFASGLYAGRWAVKNSVSERVKQQIVAYGGWLTSNTHLVDIQYSVIRLPASDSWGGGLEALDDGRVFYAAGHGGFGIVDAGGKAAALPFEIDLNYAALKKHPVFHAGNFNPNWFRVTDILLTHLKDDRYELLVGHHKFNAEHSCVELWLSRGEIELSSGSAKLTTAFRKIFAAQPCVTFAARDAVEAFNGWASGGRIVRMNDGRVLFSTGDHKWNGLNGYPAVAERGDMTLGKLMLIDVSTGESKIYAKGLRNPQGLLIGTDGRIWETEHGPRGGDELNLIVEGGDYGWPRNTYGTDYGPRPWPLNKSQGRHEGGIQPVYSWVPSIGTSNLVQVRGSEFALWKDDLLVLSLANQSLHRLRLQGDRVVYDEPIKFVGHRLRDIAQFPDGRLVLLSDEGEIILVRNGDRHGQAPYLDASRQLKRTDDMSPGERARAVEGAYGPAAGAKEWSAAYTGLKDTELRGQMVFQHRCARCHSADDGEPSIGPSLAGVVGRRVGSTRFAYSDALLHQSEYWTADEIVSFAMEPTALFPGSVMSPVTLSSLEQAELKDYLTRQR